jgi:predicted hydrocarbon binding protein
MPHAFDPRRRPQLALAPAVLPALHAALAGRLGADAVAVLQETGYATGVAYADALRDWLAERGEGRPEDLPVPAFGERLETFFRELGWGELAVRPEAGAITVVETRDWAEWQEREPGEPPSCHFSTGLLAGLFGTLAGHPLAVLEVERDEPRACRFLVGNEQVMGGVYERLQRGEPVPGAAG